MRESKRRLRLAARGFFLDEERLVAYARTPGHETYKGLGWHGVIESQGGAKARRIAAA